MSVCLPQHVYDKFVKLSMICLPVYNVAICTAVTGLSTQFYCDLLNMHIFVCDIQCINLQTLIKILNLSLYERMGCWVRVKFSEIKDGRWGRGVELGPLGPASSGR